MTLILIILLMTWVTAILPAVRRVYQPIPVPIDRSLRKEMAHGKRSYLRDGD